MFMRDKNSPSSKSGFQIGEFGICYTECHDPLARALCLMAALVALAAGWGMIAAFSWQPMGLYLLWLMLAALTFTAFAMLMLALALALPQVLNFDTTQRRVRGSARRHFGLLKNVDFDFKTLHSPKLQSFTQESGETFYQVHIGVEQQPPILLGAFSERQEAQGWCDRIAEIIADNWPRH